MPDLLTTLLRLHFREALADSEGAGDIVAVAAQGRDVKGWKRSNVSAG